MTGRKPKTIVLLVEHVTVLQELVRSGKTEQRVARRVRILLAMADGARVGPLADKFDQDPATIWRICRRYEERGLKGVYDAPRSGRRRAIPPPAAGAD
jgi:transposase